MSRYCTPGFALFALAIWSLVLPPTSHAQWQFLGLSGRQINKLRGLGGFLHACTNSGLYRLPFAASDSSWAPLGFGGENVMDMASLGPDTLLAAKALTGAPSDTVSVFRSTDAGASWEPFQNGFGAGGSRQARLLLALVGAPGTVLAIGGRMEKSTDGGLSWHPVAQGFALNTLEQVALSPRILWAGGETAIFSPSILKSRDLGETWEQLDLFAGGDNAVDAIAPHPTDSSVVYLGMEGRVMKSEDGGASWWTMTSPDPSMYTFGIAARPFLPLKIYAAGASTVPDPRGVVLHQSYDGGLSWRPISFKAYGGYGIYHLLLRVDGVEETVYAATGNGVYRYTQIPVGAPVSDGVDGIALRCLPNPFLRATEIEFSLPRAQGVSLLVFDMQGRTVAALVDGVRGTGRHRVRWDARDVRSGIYFCRLQAGHRVETLKILHLE